MEEVDIKVISMCLKQIKMQNGNTTSMTKLCKRGTKIKGKIKISLTTKTEIHTKITTNTRTKKEIETKI